MGWWRESGRRVLALPNGACPVHLWWSGGKFFVLNLVFFFVVFFFLQAKNTKTSNSSDSSSDDEDPRPRIQPLRTSHVPLARAHVPGSGARPRERAGPSSSHTAGGREADYLERPGPHEVRAAQSFFLYLVLDSIPVDYRFNDTKTVHEFGLWSQNLVQLDSFRLPVPEWARYQCSKW